MLPASKADLEFSFWPRSGNTHHEAKKELQTYYDCSRGLLETRTSRNIENETSLLVTDKGWRTRAIADGRKEMMERIEDMPESSYELSLKDIVEECVGVDEENKSKKNNKPSMEIRQSLRKKMCLPSFSFSFSCKVFLRTLHRFSNDHLHKEKFLAATTSNCIFQGCWPSFSSKQKSNSLRKGSIALPHSRKKLFHLERETDIHNGYNKCLINLSWR